MRKYDLPYGFYFLLSEAAGQALLLDLYRDLKGEKGAYPIMALCGAGMYFLSMHLGKTLYGVGHSTEGSEGKDYAPSLRDQFMYRVSEIRSRELAPIDSDRASALRRRASAALNASDKYSFPLRAALIAGYGTKVAIGAAAARQRGDDWAKAVAYGVTLPSAVIYEDSKVSD